MGAVTVGVVAWNVSGPLASTQAGLPGWGLRFSVGFLVATVAFGVVFAFNREAAWFPLYSHRILAHAHLGLLGWLGLTYVSVAEKLWPMFLLAHRRSRRSGVIAVSGFAAGVTALAPGLLFAVAPLVWVGGTLVAIGAAGHLTSLASNVRHRRRPLEVLHAFLFVSAAFLVAAIVLAGLAGAASVATTTRTRFVTAEVVALLAWIALAVVGHVHRIVPFIGYRVLRAQGITTGPSGRPLLFGDLTRPVLTRVSLLTAGAGFATVVVGILAGSASAIATGGVGVAVCGAVTTFNLASAPRRVRAAARVAASKEHHGTQRVAQPVAG